MDKTYLHISYGLSENCINDKVYCICYKCNACGRFNKDTQKAGAIKMYEDFIEEERNFDRWSKGHEEEQRKNIESNIKYFQDKLDNLKEG